MILTLDQVVEVFCLLSGLVSMDGVMLTRDDAPEKLLSAILPKRHVTESSGL